MEIQRGKDGMKNMEFNKELGATAGCTLRSLLGSISDKENFTKFGIRGDAWFGSVRAANEVEIRGHEGVFQIKTYHASYPKELIEEALKDAPGGIFVALEGTTKDEVQLIALVTGTVEKPFYSSYLPRMQEPPHLVNLTT
jgi:hypothetical protein